MHNLRRVPDGQFWHSGGMDAALAPRLDSLQPVIKHRWKQLLQSAPPAPSGGAAVVTPGMLLFMVDETLNQLSRRLRASRGDRAPSTLAPFRGMRAGCHCGLHLLLNYYLSGAKALRATLPRTLGRSRVTVLHQFNLLAHEEMTSLCGVCQHRGGERCSLRGLRSAARGLDSSGL